MTTVTPFVTTSVFSNSLTETQSDIVVSSTNDIDHNILSVGVDKEVNRGSVTPSDSANISMNQTFDPELLYPRHYEL